MDGGLCYQGNISHSDLTPCSPVLQYLWSAAGYVLIAVPLLITRTKKAVAVQAGPRDTSESTNDAVAGRTESYISNRRLLLSLADAGGRLMYAYKDLLELAGLTTRLYTLISTLHNLTPLPSNFSLGSTIELKNVDVCIPPSNSLSAAITEDNLLVDPNSQMPPLVKDLSFSLEKGQHLMITGSNGVGKTAVARVLCSLWAPSGRTPSLTRPENILVVPQRAYHVTGSLLSQVIYPHSYSQFLDSGKTLEDIQDILETVFLGYLVEREGGWTTRKEWRDVLSGGEKQRMGLARVFYHQPEFAILDGKLFIIPFCSVLIISPRVHKCSVRRC